MASLEAVYTHLVLPSKLPESRDEDPASIGHALLHRLQDACTFLHDASSDGLQRGWRVLRSCLNMCQSLGGDSLDRYSLERSLHLLEAGAHPVLTCYLAEQNACLLIYRQESGGDEVVVFEAFEAQPPSEDVLAAPNSLRWQFPSRAVQISANDFDNKSFQSSLSSFLEKASSESLVHLAATATKAGRTIPESRNGGSPALITHMLLSILMAIGGPANVCPIDKRVRDDVNFGPGGESSPWRRSPFWLACRVASHRQLELIFGKGPGLVAYKLLMATVLSQLLSDYTGTAMDSSNVVLLQKKLCRRLGKLEKLADEHSSDIAHLLREATITGIFQAHLDEASRYVHSEVSAFKRSTTRRVPFLPLRIPLDAHDFRLSLPSSESYLSDLCASWSRHHAASYVDGPQTVMGDLSYQTGTQETRGLVQNFLDVSREIAKADSKAKSLLPAIQTMHPRQVEEAVISICSILSQLLEIASSSREESPEQNSKLLLAVFDLWTVMDSAASVSCPLLQDYKPPFAGDILDVLHVSSLEDMARLRRIQEHLDLRHHGRKKKKTIFSSVGEGSFGVRYVAESDPMKDLLHSIRAQQELNRKEKTREWEQGCQRYDQYSDGISRNVCRCTYNHDGTKNVNGCNHCYNFRARKRMKISVCEDLLPEDTSKACAIVFELAIPSCIARYRDMTWAIMTQLAYPSLPVSKKQCFLLRKEPFLNKFTQNGGLQPIVSMASVKKSFSKTHYSTRKMKTDLESLLVPLGLDFKLYDSAAKVWVDDLSMPLTLAHWCGLHVPASLTSTVLPTIVHPPTSPQGPSSYEAVSSRLQCPQSISVHEFEAYQRLLSGQSRRWLTMLTELGSPNLNFSKVDTRLLFSGLASQAGPRRPSHGSDTTMGQYRDTVRGVCHSILTDDYFVCRLLEELGKRLDSIRGNWRETQTMGIIVSLTLRIHSFTESDDVRTSTSALLQSSRSTMLDWIQALGRDVRATTDSETARRNSMYAFRAALLCRRTYSAFADNGQSVMSARDVSDFLYSSVALQQNLVLDVKALPLHDRRDFRQDCVLANDLRHRIREAIEAHPASVTRAVLYGIGLDDYDSGESGRKGRTENLHISCQRFHSNTDEDWMTFILQDLADDSLKPQRIDLNYTEGHLLVGGQTANKLPQDIRDSKDVRELIGAEHLLTYASNLPGMTCRLIFKVQDNEVHFGRRNGRVIIVIRDGYGKIREYVPRHIFISAAEVYDLPRPLVDNCSHWFDCRTWKVECRRSKWISRPADWKLDLQSRQVQRRGVLLADPHSRICSKIADVFRYFADPQRLVVYLPLSERGRLSVELRHLDLSFVVGTNGCLQSRELRAEVDPDQDVGTLYGFQSKIVLRETECHDRRSIITPLGRLHHHSSGPHCVSRIIGRGVRDSAESDKAYGRFDIDDVLGRLTCPPEPLLLFTKAQLHAFTSLPLPDPLTGRTGEEESVHTLTSGRLQPWSELSNPGVEILDQIGHLAPLRTYYPEDKRVLQKTRWSSSLPICMQKDRYKRLVGEIWHKIQRLAMFSPEAKSEAAVVNTYESSLQRRGEIQQLRYECPQSRSPGFSTIQNMDLKYRSSGTFGTAGVRDDASAKLNSAADDVYHIAHVLRSDVFRVSMVRPFRDILHEWPLIGGFHSPFDAKSSSLATLMDAKTLGERWGSFVELCRTSDPAQEFNVMFTLGLLAFAPDSDNDAIYLLAAYFRLFHLRALQPPQHPSYAAFRFEEQPTAETLEALISTAYVQEEPLAAGQYLNWTATETTEASDGHLARCKAEGSRMAAYVLHEWPEKTTPTADGFTSDMIIVLDALRSIEPEWERLLRNKALSEYVVEVEKSTDSFVKGKQSRAMGKGKRIRAPRTLVTAPQSIVPSLLEDLATHDIAAPLSYKMETDHSLPTVPTQPEGAQPEGTGRRNVVQPNRSEQVLELRNIVTLFGKSSSTHRSKYSHDLSGSLDALEDAGNMQKEMGLVEAKLPSLGSIQNRISNSLHAANAEFTRLVTAFSSNTTQEADTTSGHGQAWLHQGGQWPRLTFVSMLELLQSTSKVRLGKNVKKSLVSFGCAVANLQRLKRVQRLCQKGHTHRAKEEWQNRGHGSWKPQDNPDWLLLEIDSDILIREEQVEVAREIIAPGKRRNSVLQLNMGKGKTSCIVPMAMAVLADGQQLVRLIVPKTLLLPTAQMVQSRLGGLVGRELRHVPFSRRTASGPTGHDLVQIFKQHHYDLMENRGVLLAAPEHILAFKLSGLQCLADGKIDVGNDMIRFQDHLTRTMCRDVLDESDFTLAVQTQLVYPSGQLTTVDGSPHRWKLMQMLLSVVEDNLPTLCSDFPHAVNVVQRPSGGFPMVYILGTEINEEIRRVIVDSISNGCVPFFHPAPRKTPKRRIQATASPQEASQLIRRALSDDASQEDVDEAALLFHDPNSVSEGLLLVRGLLANGILSTCLKKRWNVQYGLHPRRWPIAVPYEAKGVPSERSEFGHPDVAILFTCLAFYYTGLDKSQLREGLRHVLQHADDPAVEYERWISGCNPENPPEGCQPEGLPAELHHWNVVNIDDDGQVETLWQQLRMTRPVIDHYLNTFVFPVHARQFSVKLQVSAWDLPIFNPGQDGEEGSGGLGARTTGFSGTNDNKMMLPLTISQDDLASLRQTNAEVLTHLLQPRNRQYVCTQDGRQRWSEDRLIHALVKSQTRILIDAGAYILEKDNEAFVQAWLLAEKERPAAVFFGASDNRAWVLFRDSTVRKAPLIATPFADRLGECLIYFDEAHTRGVDLLLPPDACGALTLALGQTKDHTVQAAMRLRQLGSTQSVVFYAPPEVDQSIRDVCLQVLGVNPGRIESNHAVLWLLEQTCQANEQLHSLYLSYGRDFCRRSDAQLRYGGRLGEVQSRKALLRVLEQPERQTLVQLYGNDPTAARETPTPRLASERLRGFADQLAAQKQAVISTRNEAPTGDSTGAFEEVEQEREVEAQVEQIRIKQTRKKYPALSFPGLDKAMVEFVRTGELAPSGRWYEPAFKFIAETNVGMQYRVRAVSSRVFVTVQFRRTTALSNNEQRQLDNFMRPVEWVLWSPTKETALVIIPEELELLLPEIRASKAVHLLVYAAPVTRAMVRFGSLKYLTLPPLRDDYQFPAWLGTELGILAGQLYMTYDESVDMGDYLRDHAFCQDMAGFLMEWLSLRRMGQDVMHTPAAYVCQGRPLRRDHAIFAEHGRKVEADSTAPVSGSNVEERNKGEGLEETADQVGELKIEE